jgi:hypothetical protein
MTRFFELSPVAAELGFGRKSRKRNDADAGSLALLAIYKLFRDNDVRVKSARRVANSDSRYILHAIDIPYEGYQGWVFVTLPISRRLRIVLFRGSDDPDAVF